MCYTLAREPVPPHYSWIAQAGTIPLAWHGACATLKVWSRTLPLIMAHSTREQRGGHRLGAREPIIKAQVGCYPPLLATITAQGTGAQVLCRVKRGIMLGVAHPPVLTDSTGAGPRQLCVLFCGDAATSIGARAYIVCPPGPRRRHCPAPTPLPGRRHGNRVFREATGGYHCLRMTKTKSQLYP